MNASQQDSLSLCDVDIRETGPLFIISIGPLLSCFDKRELDFIISLFVIRHRNKSIMHKLRSMASFSWVMLQYRNDTRKETNAAN